ncbi:MAG: SRPBCC domain-containing protein [Thermoanaerobaculia bacterium]
MTTKTPRAGTLEVTMPSDREIKMTRCFDAPRALVFDSMVKPELLKRWMLGPPGWTMAICEVDLRVGGGYRVVWRGTGPREEFTVSGVYKEVAAPERFVNTETMGNVETLQTNVFTEANGRTTFTQTTLFATREDCDATMKSGAGDGMDACYDNLEDMLRKMA